MCLWSLLDAKIDHEGQRSVTTFMYRHLDTLIDHGLIHEATEVLYLACVFVNNHRFALLDFKKTYLYLHDRIEVNISQASTTEDLKHNMLIKLRLRSALLIASRSQNEKGFTDGLSQIEHLKTIDHDVNELSLGLCGMLDIGPPSEGYVAYYTRRWDLRPRMVAGSPTEAPQQGLQILNVSGQLFITQARGQLRVDSFQGNTIINES